MAQNQYVPPQGLVSEAEALNARPGPQQMYLTPGGTLTSSAQNGWIQNTPYNPGGPAEPERRRRDRGEGDTPPPTETPPAEDPNMIVGKMGSYPKLDPSSLSLPPLPQGTLTLPSMAGGTLTLPQMPQGSLPAPMPQGSWPPMPTPAAPAASASTPAASPVDPAVAAGAPTTGWGAQVQHSGLNLQSIQDAIMNRMADARANAQTPEGRKQLLETAAGMLTPKPVTPSPMV